MCNYGVWASMMIHCVRYEEKWWCYIIILPSSDIAIIPFYCLTAYTQYNIIYKHLAVKFYSVLSIPCIPCISCVPPLRHNYSVLTNSIFPCGPFKPPPRPPNDVRKYRLLLNIICYGNFSQKIICVQNRRIKLAIFNIYNPVSFSVPAIPVKLLPSGGKSINSHYRYRNFLDRRLSWGEGSISLFSEFPR